MALQEGQARQALLDVLFYVLGDPRMTPAPPSGQLRGEPEGHFPVRCFEHPAQVFGELLTPLRSHHPQEIPRVVDLAPLVGGTLEVAGYGRFEPLVVVGDYNPHARKPPPLQRAKQIPVGGLALSVRNLHREYLPQPIVPHSRDDQCPLAYHPRVHPHLLVAGVHEQVGVCLRLQPTIPPRFELRVQAANEERRLLEKEVPHSFSVTSLTFLVETPSRYISIKAKTSAFSLRW